MGGGRSDPAQGYFSPRPRSGRSTHRLFASNKPAAPRIMDVLERKMKERFPASEISRYNATESFLVLQMAGKERSRFEEWVKGVDGIAAAVGN